MASTFFNFFLIYSILFISSSSAQTRPKGLILPVSKYDGPFTQYTVKIKQRTPLVSFKLTLDLGGPLLWVGCDKGYTSSTYRTIDCNSAECSLVNYATCGGCNPPIPACTNNTCTVLAENTYTFNGIWGPLSSDVFSVKSVVDPKPFTISQLLFVCAPGYTGENLATGVQGIAGLGRTNISLPSQFFPAFNLKRKFGLCLSSSNSPNGSLFFGDFDFSSTAPLTYTPLLLNPLSTGSFILPGPSSDYFIGVKSIKINKKVVKIDPQLLSINATNGNGGTLINTKYQYSMMQTSIYEAVRDAFVKQVKAPQYGPRVGPFDTCFNSSDIKTTKMGPDVPTIDLVLQNKNAKWRIYGKHSMVRVGDDLLCLGINGAANLRASILIAGHQLEDHLLEFDIASSKLGFSRPLFLQKKSCANFKFATWGS